MVRPPFEDTSKLTKGPWTKEEDKKLKDYILKHGHKNWRALPKRAGLNRCGKSCRLRWMNYLRPDIKRGDFSDEEEHLIIKLHSQLPNKWSRIASQLPGRTDNEIKNYWNTHLRKKLLRVGVDPITHQPLLYANLLTNLSLLNLMTFPNFNNTFNPNNNLQLPQILMQMLNQNALDPTNVLLRNTFDPTQISQNVMQITNPNLLENLPFDYNNLGPNPQVFNTIPSASNSMASSECEFQLELDNSCYNYLNNDCVLQSETPLPNLISVETPNIVNQVDSNFSPIHSLSSIMFEDWDKFWEDDANVIQ